MVISHRAPAQCKFFTSHQSRVTSREIQLYFSRGRKGSGDLPGLQSRRFGSSRAEWWVRLPHASAKSPMIRLPLWESEPEKDASRQGFWTQVGPNFWGEPLGWHKFFGHSFRFHKGVLVSPSRRRGLGKGTAFESPSPVALSKSFWHSRYSQKTLSLRFEIRPCFRPVARILPEVDNPERSAAAADCNTPRSTLRCSRANVP